ncbi:MAG: PA2778 family cysteine peptidase [Desulfobacterales bacterium]
MKLCRIDKSLRCLSLLLGFIVAALCGCSALQRTQMPPRPAIGPGGYELVGVPFYPQTAYQCGPSSLAMALTYQGLSITPEELKSQVFTPALKGSLQMDMVGATRRHGKIAYEITGPEAIFPEIAAGHPVIILQNLGFSWRPVWHYAIVIGYNFTEKNVILRSGVTQRKVMSYYTFEKSWVHSNYWGLLVLEPTQIPVAAEETKYLTAVLGLEKSRQFQAAVSGYQTALTRWPGSLPGLMGLGNSYYALADLPGAENAFREATEQYPLVASAYNNLAQVLIEQGRKREALAAAQKAVSLGGPMVSVSKKTLQEIQSTH